MRQKMIKHLWIFLVLFLLFTGSLPLRAQTEDDPGAMRLSGAHIPEEFYEGGEETVSPFTTHLFQRYGGFTTVNPYTGKTYTHQDRFADRTVISGIDVSQYQQKIDWAKVKAAGIDFAIVRVGYRGYGDAGTLSDKTMDSFFDANMKGALAAGLKVGVYVYSQATTTAEAVEEAEYILNRIGDYQVTLPLVMDYEYADTSQGLGGRLYKAKLSKEAATNVCLAFCDRVIQAGYTPMVYANKSMLESQLNADALNTKCRVWLANYITSTSYTGAFDFWQYASDGKVDGISGSVDMNYYYAKADEKFVADPGAPVTPADPGTTDPGTSDPGTAGPGQAEQPTPTEPVPVSISGAVISPVADQIYTGQEIKPSVTVTLDGKILTYGIDYQVSYHDNKEIGAATVQVTGEKGYRDTVSAQFRILPVKPGTLVASKRAKTSITLSWTKDSAVTGYEIYRSTSANGTFEKVKTITSAQTTTWKNTGLTAGTCYYYKLVSYKTSGGQTYESAPSAVSSLSTTIAYTRIALAKSGAVVYASASTASHALASPAVNTSMTVGYATTDAAGKKWYHVSFKMNGGTYNGFVKSGKVKVGKKGYVNGSAVNVRKSASLLGKRITTLGKKKTVTVLKKKTVLGLSWYKITFKKGSKYYTGWMAAHYITIQ